MLSPFLIIAAVAGAFALFALANELQESKVFNAIPAGVIKDDAAFVSNVIDKADLDGADYGEFHIALGATDVPMATLKVMESDTKTNGTTLGGSPTAVHDVTVKPGATDDGAILVVGIDLRASRQRYLQLQATAGDGTAGTYLAATFVAVRAHEAGSDATSRGVLLAEYA